MYRFLGSTEKSKQVFTKFLIYDPSEDRSMEIVANLKARLPGCHVEVFSSEEAADTHQRLYGGMLLHRKEISQFLSTLAAGQDMRLDDLRTIADSTLKEVQELRTDLDKVMVVWDGDGLETSPLPIRLKKLEEHDQRDYDRFWIAIKWTMGALVGLLLYFLGKWGDKIETFPLKSDNETIESQASLGERQ